jgi:hypothetical protein
LVSLPGAVLLPGAAVLPVPGPPIEVPLPLVEPLLVDGVSVLAVPLVLPLVPAVLPLVLDGVVVPGAEDVVGVGPSSRLEQAPSDTTAARARTAAAQWVRVVFMRGNSLLGKWIGAKSQERPKPLCMKLYSRLAPRLSARGSAACRTSAAARLRVAQCRAS